MNNIAKFFFITFVLLFTVRPLNAQWTTDPTKNTVVSKGNNQLYTPVMAPDGSGGVFIVWSDERAANSHIFAQHFDGNGNALWASGGDTVCYAGGYQYDPTVSTDGHGGAYFAWDDARDTVNDVEDLYAQHFTGAGHASWAQNGINVTNNGIFSIGTDMKPIAIPDGSGGCIVTFFDNLHVQAARLDSTGTQLWKVVTVNGVFSTSEQAIASTGDGGCIITELDQNELEVTGDLADITAQKIDPAGNLVWGPAGAMVCNATNLQGNPAIVSDGLGGAIIAWEDFRSGVMYEIYSQRVNAAGSRVWINGTDSNGVLITDPSREGNAPLSMAATSTHGAIMVWNDNSQDVYVQNVDSSGNLLFGASDLHVTNLPSVESFPVLTGDGADGAYIAWEDTRNAISTRTDIYAQHIRPNGTFVFPANGVAVSSANYDQTDPVIMTDPQGGAIVAWYDQRTYHTGSNNDLYAQRIDANGSLLSVKQGTADIPAKFSVAQNYPNPFNPTTTINFTVAKAEHATLTVYDMLGRTVEKLFDGPAAPEKSYDVRFNASRYVSGVYFYRVSTPSASQVKRMLLVK